MLDHFRARLRAARVRGLAALASSSPHIDWDAFADLHYSMDMLNEAEAIMADPLLLSDECVVPEDMPNEGHAGQPVIRTGLGTVDPHGAAEAYIIQHGDRLYEYRRVQVMGFVDPGSRAGWIPHGKDGVG